MTTWTPTANFGGFSQTLKEQSGEKMYLGVFTYLIAIVYKHEGGGEGGVT